MRTLTWKDFQQFEPCYNPQERYGDFSGTAIDLLTHPKIPNHDKIWAITRLGILSEKTLRLLAVAWAREVQHLMKDERSVKALDVSEAYAHGNATKEELEETRAVAWTVAWGARAAALAAAAAAAAAAEAEAEDSAAAAARAVAKSNQIQIAIEIIQKYEA